MRKNLDAELAEAAGIDDSDDDASMSVPQPAPTRGQPRDDGAADASPPAAPRRGNKGLLMTLLVMVTAIVALFMFGFKEAAIYSMPLSQFLEKSAEYTERRVRIEGELVPGTLTKRDTPCEYRFTVRDVEQKDDGGTLQIRFPQCIIPDTFRDMPEGGVLVTAEGQLHEDGHFVATEIMAKCSSKYDPEQHEMTGGPKEQAQAE